MEGRIRRIRDWSVGDRPRDKLYTKKADALTNAELLAMLIGPGNARANSLKLAQNVLSACGNSLSEMAKCSIHDLMRTPGIGWAKACAMVALGELSRRHQLEKATERRLIKDSRDAAAFFEPHLQHLQYEAFGVLFLKQNGCIIDFEIISTGGLTSSTVDPRRVFKTALMHQATSIVAGHNHPSGSPRPSKADEALTQKLLNGSKYMDIKLLDHVIIGENGYYSFADEGLLS